MEQLKQNDQEEADLNVPEASGTLNPRLVAVDLDGTFLDGDSKVPPANRAIVRELQAAGIEFVVASGRVLERFPDDVLGIPGMHYAVCSNGAAVMDLRDRSYVGGRQIPEEAFRRFIEETRDLAFYFEVYCDGGSYIEEARRIYYHDGLHPAGVLADMKKSEHFIGSFLELLEPGHHIEKIFIPHVPEQCAELYDRVRRMNGFTASSSRPGNLELNAIGCSKIEGLVTLGRVLGVEPAEIMAFGDASNDRDMLAGVGYSVAMANATDEIKRLCRFIGPHHHPHGVADFLHQRVLRG